MQVEVEGVDYILQRMMKFDKDAWTILQREIRSAMSDIQSDAKAAVPDPALGSWGPWKRGNTGGAGFRNTTGDRPFSGSAVQGSIKAQARSRRSRQGGRLAYGQVVINDAAGAIFSLAGSKNRSGHRFNDNLNKKYGAGPWPRLLGPAWTKNIDTARDMISAAIDSAAREVTRG